MSRRVRFLPDLRVEIDGRATPNIWTNPAPAEWRRIDRTNGVREYHGRKIGAENIWTRPVPSELTLTLANGNGYLDPTFTGSPYNGLLTRRRQLRVVYAPNLLADSVRAFLTGWSPRAGASIVDDEGGRAIAWGGANGGSALVDLVSRVPVVAGQSITATVYYRAKAGNPGAGSPFARIILDYFDATGTFLSSTLGADFDDTAEVEASVAGTVPTGAVEARAVLQISDLATGDRHYVSDIVVGRRIPKFHGLVERWPVQWTSTGADAESELLVIDRLGALGRDKLPPSLVEYELDRGVRYPRPTHLYVYRERVGPSGSYIDAIGTVHGTTAGGPVRTVGENLLPYAPPGGFTGGAEGGGYVLFGRSLLPTMSAAMTLTVLAVARVNEGGAGLLLSNTQWQFPSFQLAVTDVGFASKNRTMRLAMRDDSLNQTEYLIGPDRQFADGHPYSYWLTYVGNVDTLYGDYQRDDATIITGIGGIVFEDPEQFTDRLLQGLGANVNYGLLATWTVDVVPSQKEAIHADIFRPWENDGGEARLSKLLAIAAPGVPFVQGASSTGSLMPVAFLSRSPLELIGTLMIEHADRFFATNDGTLKVITAGNLPPVSRTYGPGGTPYQSISVRQQSDPIASVTWTNEAGSSVTVGDPSGGADLPIAGGSGKAEFMRGNAQRVLDSAAAEAQPAVDAITLQPVHPDVDWIDTMSLDLYDRHDVAYKRPWGAIVTERREVCGIFEDATLRMPWTTTVRYRKPADF